MLVVLLMLTLITVSMYSGGHTKHGWFGFVLGIAFIALFAMKQQSLASAANAEHELATLALIGAERSELVAQREELYASSAELDPNAGEIIFNQLCSACHAFDSKIVGPPYNDVLPKYSGDVEALAGFIFRPEKIDPDYPAMPGQGLKRAEAGAVAEYLITRFSGEPPEGDGS
jgi:cytochrome c551/c552